MKEITILSGKGGTGKTTVTAAFASLTSNAVFCDTDVDASDLHLILNPENTEEHNFSSGENAVIVQSRCTACGKCLNYCRFGAVEIRSSGEYFINPIHCEGCRLCYHVCPSEAIDMVQTYNNRWYISETRFGKFVHARMGAGEENSGKLVTRLRREASKIAECTKADYIINDGPPGIGCPVIASLTGTGAVLLVTEPTLSGFHDAIRLAELVQSMQIRLFLLINKYDLNPEIASQIESFFKNSSAQFTGSIYFEKRIIDAMSEGKNIIEYSPGCKASRSIRDAWETITRHI